MQIPAEISRLDNSELILLAMFRSSWTSPRASAAPKNSAPIRDCSRSHFVGMIRTARVFLISEAFRCMS